MERRDAWLATTAAAYAVCHHLGSLPDGIGAAGRGTRWTDWLDLLVPVAVLAPALLTLVSAGAGRSRYAAFAIGSWLYATGHGIHLAANSIGNVAPGETAHLWDEQIGHWVWYAGVAVVFAVLATTLAARERTSNPGAWVLAAAVGATWGTNATGGEFTWAGAVLATAALAWGVRYAGTGAGLVVAVGASGAVAVVVSAVIR